MTARRLLERARWWLGGVLMLWALIHFAQAIVLIKIAEWLQSTEPGETQ